MITDSELDRLLTVRTRQRSVLSLYLWVPSDPAELRELPARAHGLLTLAASNGSGHAGPADLSGGARGAAGRVEQRARTILQQHGREWLGHTAAIFVADQTGGPGAQEEPGGPDRPGDGGPGLFGAAGLAEAFSLPGRLPDRAVLAAGPHIRPLLVARQRFPAHYVAIVDREHAWLFRVIGEDIESATAAHADESGEIPDLRERRKVRSAGFGGWYGLESYRINERIIELAHEHFLATIDRIERAAVAGLAGATDEASAAGFADLEPLVVGGHEQTISQFVGMLPPGLRARLAGTFVVDTHTMTPARVRDLASGIIADWVGMHEERRTLELREADGLHDPLTVTGLNRCLHAVNQHAADLLVVPVGGVIDGYVCEHCGALGAAVTGCPDGPAESRWVPDLFEEMVVKVIADGGRIEALSDPPGDVAAHLRFPVTQSDGR